MSHPLEARIRSLRGRARRMLAFHGLCRVLALLLVAVLLLGLADWSLHLAREVRLVLLVALGGLTLYLLAREVLRPLFARFRDLDLALRIEQFWPGLQDRLASTLQFIRLAEQGGSHDEGRDGSKTLREATIRDTLAEIQSIDFTQVIDPRPVRSAAYALAAAGGLALLPLVVSPVDARIALTRLFHPLGSTQWPRRTHLSVAQLARKAAIGEPYEFAIGLAPGDSMPRTAQATYRFADGEVLTEPLRADFQNRLFRGRIESVDRSFDLSVAAGDDRTPSLPVAAVPTPSLNDLAISLTPPAYTGLSTERMADGRTQVQAVKGTRIALQARATKPLVSAQLVPMAEGEPPLAVGLGADRQSLSVDLALTETSSYTFDLRDTDGFSAHERDRTRIELRALDDETPRVNIDEPPADRDVTPNARIPVHAVADDDFGLANLRILYKVARSGSEATEEVILPLWTRDPATTPAQVKHQEMTHDWDLAPLQLPAGAIVSFFADARDLHDGSGGPHTGKSRELRLRVVSTEEIRRQLEAEQREIRELVARLAEMQEQAARPVNDARRTLQEGGQIQPPERDDLNNAATIQRQVTDRFSSRSDGLAEKLRRLLDNIDQLRVEAPDLQNQMKGMQAAVDRIQKQNLAPAEQGLTEANKTLQQPNETNGGQQPPPDNSKPAPSDKSSAQNEPNAAAAEKSLSNPPAQNEPKSAPAPNEPTEPKSSAPNDKQQTPTSKSATQNEPKPTAESTQPVADSPKDSPAQALAQAAENQKAIADELKQMLDQMKQFETYSGVVQEAKNLLRDQEQAMKTSADLAGRPELAGKTADQLDAQQRADLANAGTRQDEVARALEQLEAKMDEMAQQLETNDPMAAAALREAAQQSRQQGTAARMGENARQLRDNQTASARSGQEQSRDELQKLLDNLQNRREQELARLVKELKDSERALQSLKDRQQKNKQATGKARQNANEQERKQELQRLAKEQEQIQEETKKQLQKLQKLRAQAAANAASRASSRMAKAQQGQEADDGEEAEAEQEEALANLDEAQQETEQARREAEEKLAQEQLARLADGLKALSEQQEKLLTDTADYDQKRQGADSLSAAQRAGVRALARVQTAVKQETSDLVGRLEGAPVFSLILKRAAENMSNAADRLQKLQTDLPTQSAERSAASRFKQLLEALQPDKGKGGQGQQQGGGGGGGGGGGSGGDGITAAAQIKMLKLLQQEINDRTDTLDQIRQREQKLSPEQEAELEHLREDQQNVLDLARDLTRPRHDDAEED